MAESYTVPGQTCDVGVIKSKFPALDDTRGWNAFCDCMFLNPVLREQVYLDGALLEIPPGFKEQARSQYIALKSAEAKARNPAAGRVVLREEVVLQRTEDWQKCVSNFCAVPWGCPHPTIPGFTMPFNVSPAAGSPPWTEFGAAARGIPKRNAGFFYTVGQVITVDLKDYEPLNLWRDMFLNPAKFNLVMAKLAVFVPVIGPALFANLNSLATFTPGDLGLPLNKNIILLLPFALTQAAIERRSVVDAIVKPAITGSVKNGALLLKVAGPALGGEYFTVAGAVMARFAEDQIETGEINKVLDPFTNGFIRFLATSGERLGRDLQSALGAGLKVENFGDLIRTLEKGLLAVADSPQVPENAKTILRAVAKVLGVAGVMVTVLSDKTLPPDVKTWKIVDDVCYKLFGFSLSELRNAVTQGGGAVNALLDRAKRLQKPSSLDAFTKEFEGLSVAMQKVIDALAEVNRMLDGGVEKFVSEMQGLKAALDSVGRETTSAFASVAKAPGTGATTPAAVPVTPRGIRTDRAGTALARIPVAKQPPPPPAKEQPMNTLPLLGAAAGFFVGGPIGAAAGLAIGGALAPKPKAMAGFRGFGRDMTVTAKMDSSTPVPVVSTTSALPLRRAIMLTDKGPATIDPNMLIGARRPIAVAKFVKALNPVVPATPTGLVGGTRGEKSPPVAKEVNTGGSGTDTSLPRFDPSDPSADNPPPVVKEAQPEVESKNANPDPNKTKDKVVNAGLGVGAIGFAIAAILVARNLR